MSENVTTIVEPLSLTDRFIDIFPSLYKELVKDDFAYAMAMRVLPMKERKIVDMLLDALGFEFKYIPLGYNIITAFTSVSLVKNNEDNTYKAVGDIVDVFHGSVWRVDLSTFNPLESIHILTSDNTSMQYLHEYVKSIVEQSEKQGLLIGVDEDVSDFIFSESEALKQNKDPGVVIPFNKGN